MLNKIKTIRKSQLVKDSFLYGLTNALFTGLPLFLMPFLVGVMSPEDYGIVDLFRSVTMILVPVLGLSTLQSITRFYYDLDEDSFKTFSSSVILFHFFTTIIAVFIISISSLFISSQYILLSYLAVLYFLFNQITEALLSIYRVKRFTKKYMAIRIGTVIADLGLLALFYFFYKKYDWTYRILPNVISTIIYGVISLFLLWVRFGIKLKFNKALLTQSIVYSAPLILHMISGYILNVGDRFAITHFLGPKALGNYSVAYQIGMSVNFFFTSFNLAWTPTFFEWMKQEKFSLIKKVKKIVYISLPILSAIIILSWVVLSRYISNLNKYNVDIKILIIIGASYVILSYYRFNSNYFFYYKNTQKLATITTTTGILCAIGYIILIPRIGIMGAAITTFITFSIMYIFVSNTNKMKKNDERYNKNI